MVLMTKIYQHYLDKQIQVEAHHSQPRSLRQQIQSQIRRMR